MSNKAKSIYFAVFAVLYFGYTIFIARHGVHFTNTAITLGSFGLAWFYYLKYRGK